MANSTKAKRAQAKSQPRTLPEGTDLADLKRSQVVRELTFAHAGQAWTFKYVAVSWDEHWKAVESAWEVEEDDKGEKSLEFDVKKYYFSLLPKIIVEVPGGGPMTEEFLAELDTVVVAKLATVVPSPLLDREVEAIKKEPRPMSVAEREDTGPS